MGMKKKMLSATLCAVMVGSLAAPAFTVQAADDTLVYWSMWEATEPQGQVIQEAVDAYTEQTGVKVDLQFKGRTGNREALQPALDGGTQIDIFDEDIDRVNGMYGKYLLDLEDLAKENDYEATANAGLMAACRDAGGGTLKTIPYQPNVFAFFYNKDLFEQQFPAKFISEAVDQTRGWFYSLLAISTLLFNKAPYENVIVLGHVQDADGQKMSKSKGNAVDPFDALQKHGADAIRWYFYENSAPWLPNRFHDKAVTEGQRKFMGTIWNTYAFFVLYANIDNFDATQYKLEYDKLPVMDKWILSKLNTLIKTVDNNLNDYKITETARALEDFVDELSNWYVRRSRERFWAKGMEQDKINAYMTLYTALVTVSKAAAPMIPFMTEEIYQNLVRSIDKDAPESIHLCDFPEVHEEQIDKELENNMEHVLDLVVMGRACRNASNIKNRQPIGKMFVKADFDLPEFYQEIVADELNVKNVKFTDDVRDFTSYSFKPQLKTVGPKYGKMLGGIKAALNDIDGNAAMDELNATGALKLDVNGQVIELFKEDLLIDTAQIEGYESVNDNGITVVLDTNLSPELLEEGFVREIISKIQTMRKEADFEVMDRIKVTYEGSEKAEAVFEKNNTLIAGEVLADEVVKAQPAGYVKEWKINGEAVTMGVEKKGE